MKLIVSGSQSFIGSALRARCLAQEIEWVGLDTRPGPGTIQVDICDPAIGRLFPAGASALVHLAAVSRYADCSNDPPRAFRVNLEGTWNLIQAALEAGVGQFIFASSEWVYAEASVAPRNEDSPINANAHTGVYPLTKLVGERLLETVAGRDLAVTVLRFGIVYGPRPANWSAVESLFDAVSRKDKIEVGSLLSARRFVHVEDICSGILAALGRRGFEIFNLTGDSLISLGDIIEASSQFHGRRPRVIERDPGRPSIRNIDNAKARRLLGWSPRIGLAEGLATLAPALVPAGGG